jgi:hypothetical protein
MVYEIFSIIIKVHFLKIRITAQNSFRLANIYQNDMVLQMEPKSARIWGFGEADARIEINYEQNQVVTAVNGKIQTFTNVR